MNSQRTMIPQHAASLSRRARPRAGLAPLELVISLPLLLTVMALIVNFSHAATWKIRSATSARLAMWRHRPMWSADNDPKPVNFWAPGSSLGVGGGTRISQVDAAWDHSRIAQGWIKGPVFVAGDGYLAVRDNRVNEMAEGVSIGRAEMSLQYPFIPAMGFMGMRAQNELLDSVWQFHTMGYGWNEARRAKGWWQIEDSADWASEKSEFLNADSRMVNNPQRELMRPLDRDLDLMAFFGPDNPRSDFYTVAPYFCVDDPLQIQQLINEPGGFLDRIRGVKGRGARGVNERMARSYLEMYQAELAMLEAQENPPAQRIAQLKAWIKELTDFIEKLP